MNFLFLLPLITLSHWTRLGIKDFLGTSSVNKKSNFHKKLIVNQVLPFFWVLPGIVVFGLADQVGLTPSLTLPWYLFAFISGVIFTAYSTGTAILTQLTLQKYFPKVIEEDLLRYELNVKKGLGKLTRKQSIILSIFNGFSEEIVMRVFIIGVLSVFFNFPIILCAFLSLLLNAIHHSYQGRVLGTLGAAFAHTPYILLYIYIEDFLFIAIAHVANDMTALLLLPKIFQSEKK